jgi:hypothetical protein
VFYWFELVLYLYPAANFPETTKKPGFFVIFADNVGDVLTFNILKNGLSTVLHRSLVRSAADPLYRNKRPTFNSDVQETLEKLDTTPGTLKHSDTKPKQRSRKTYDEVSYGSKSKTGNIDQNNCDRTRCKVHAISFSGTQGSFFLFYDTMSFEDKRK